jgi:hypothetical protein
MAPGIIRAMNADGAGCGKISRKKSPENFHYHCSRGFMVRDARRRAPHHEGLIPHPEEQREAMRLEG